MAGHEIRRQGRHGVHRHFLGGRARRDQALHGRFRVATALEIAVVPPREAQGGEGRLGDHRPGGPLQRSECNRQRVLAEELACLHEELQGPGRELRPAGAHALALLVPGDGGADRPLPRGAAREEVHQQQLPRGGGVRLRHGRGVAEGGGARGPAGRGPARQRLPHIRRPDAGDVRAPGWRLPAPGLRHGVLGAVARRALPLA
mmetsp:Transcript_98347/g.261291  ORF Transcript_98347/g.261291 Transcript_98347/m.261291 type:complete len:203 (-) Transcript_98347:90-698(-)